jgi:N-acetylmuramoyl-L-alanine amidase
MKWILISLIFTINTLLFTELKASTITYPPQEVSDINLNLPLVHKVKEKETLWSISKRYGIPIEELMRVNNLKSPKDLKVGQLLYIGRIHQKKEDKNLFYVVKKGDTLKSIAQLFSTSPERLIQINKLNFPTLKIGQILQLPAKEEVIPTLHKVEEKETLWSISKRYGIPIEELMRVNNLKSSRDLKVGQLLYIGHIYKKDIEEKEGPKQVTLPLRQFASNSVSSTITTLELPLSHNLPKSSVSKVKVIVIDPGHGGKDPGAVSSRGTKEKDLNLFIAKRLAYFLKSLIVPCEVILTREEDIFLPLAKRVAIANHKGGDIFVSIHNNAAIYSSACGFEVYYLSPEASDSRARAYAALENDVLRRYEGIAFANSWDNKTLKLILSDMVQTNFIKESAKLAHCINHSVIKNLNLKQRGVKSAPFYVLKGAMMPAVLVECAFLSNPKEEAYLNNDNFCDSMAYSIALGIKEFLNK